MKGVKMTESTKKTRTRTTKKKTTTPRKKTTTPKKTTVYNVQKVKKVEPQKREAYKVAVKPECPRCGEKVSLVLEKTSTAGQRYYRCFSEECKKNSVRPGKGRGFVVPLGRANLRK